MLDDKVRAVEPDDVIGTVAPDGYFEPKWNIEFITQTWNPTKREWENPDAK